MEWQPIETAPKTGEFLAYDSITRTMDVCFTLGDLGICQSQFDGTLGPLKGEFGYDSAGITHWMPLPPPPQSED